MLLLLQDSSLPLLRHLDPVERAVESPEDVIVRVHTLGVVCLLAELRHILAAHPPPPGAVPGVDR